MQHYTLVCSRRHLKSKIAITRLVDAKRKYEPSQHRAG